MVLKPCAKCGHPIPYGQRYCTRCQPIMEQRRKEQAQQRSRRYDAGRDPKMVAFYHSKEWRTLSQLVLQKAGYLCQYCGKAIATEVDHVVPLEKDWERRFDTTNLKATCHQCHNRKHGRFGPRGT